ncbi:FAD-binding domain-containing protein [Amycolatopsis cihanbeyliensis]|uniref:FAD-binding domain-containing protein n=1 Tax=Amycolatopsis cihanbeyliensis TaxID=1128664 RepID=UPI00319DE2DA
MANNQLNWQWVAGTGTDSRPNRVLNPLPQASRHDPLGEYVRRHLPELAGSRGAGTRAVEAARRRAPRPGLPGADRGPARGRGPLPGRPRKR